MVNTLLHSFERFPNRERHIFAREPEMRPIFLILSVQVDNCHVETRAKCKDVTHNVPVTVCDDQLQGPVIALPGEAEAEPAVSAQSTAATAAVRSFSPFSYPIKNIFDGK